MKQQMKLAEESLTFLMLISYIGFQQIQWNF